MRMQIVGDMCLSCSTMCLLVCWAAEPYVMAQGCALAVCAAVPPQLDILHQVVLLWLAAVPVCLTLMYIMLSALTARSSLNCGASCSRTAFRKPPMVSPLRTATCSRNQPTPEQHKHTTALTEAWLP